MATDIKDSVFIWVSIIFVLLANLAVMILLYLYQPTILKKLSPPLIISIFLSEALRLFGRIEYFYDSKLWYTGRMICSLFLFFWVILDIFLFKSEKNGDDNNETNEENENNDNSANDKKFDINNFDFSTALFAVVMWITYMMDGIVTFADSKGLNEGSLQIFFYFVLFYATLQFVYGLYVINQNVSKVFYLIYMTPQAVLWPLASLISYYVHKGSNAMIECYSCFSAFMIATLLYLVFKIYYQYPKYVKDEAQNKGFHFVFLIIGLLWYYIVGRISSINNSH